MAPMEQIVRGTVIQRWAKILEDSAWRLGSYGHWRWLLGGERILLWVKGLLVCAQNNLFFGFGGGGLPAEMFRGAKEKVRFSDPPQVRFLDLEKLPADQLLNATIRKKTSITGSPISYARYSGIRNFVTGSTYTCSREVIILSKRI